MAASLLLHALIAALVLLDLHLPDPRPAQPREIPVEIVAAPPEKTPPEPPEAELPEKTEPEPPAPQQPEPEPEPEAEAEPDSEPPKTPEEPPEQAGGQRTAPMEPVPEPEPEPEPAAPEAPPGPDATLPAPKPEAPPKPPAPEREQAARRGEFEGDWVLQPLEIDLGHACGWATITGAIALEEEVRPGVYDGVLQTTIEWALCRPEGARYRIRLRVHDDGSVTMTGSGGFVDRGVMQDDVMILRDEYGKSVWRRR